MRVRHACGPARGAHGGMVLATCREVDSWQVAILAIAALLVGAAIPVLVQMWSTLRRVSRLADDVAPAMADARVTARRLAHATRSLDGRDDDLGRLLDGANRLADTLDHFRDTSRLAGTIGAVVAAGITAFRETSEARARDAAAGDAGDDVDDHGGNGAVHRPRA
jgi:hypothetical protein